MISSIDELDKFLDRRARIFTEALTNIARARLEGRGYYEAVYELAELIRRTMILSNLHGRRRLLMEYDHIRRQASRFTALPDETPIVPHVEFTEAIDDLIAREPRLAKSAEEVSQLYSTENVFAMAKAAAGNVDDRIAKARTEAVQRALTKSLVEGQSMYETTAILKEIGPWTQAYGETIYKTNLSSAYNNGRVEQAKDKDIQEVIPAIKLVTRRDTRVRENHEDGDGFIAPVDHPAWKKVHPPLGFQCRCSVQFVSVFSLERMGLIKDGKVVPYFPPKFAGCKPDDGFRVGDYSGSGLGF